MFRRGKTGYMAFFMSTVVDTQMDLFFRNDSAFHFGYLTVENRTRNYVLCRECLKNKAVYVFEVPTCGSEPPHVLLLLSRGCLRHRNYIRVVVSCPSASLDTTRLLFARAHQNCSLKEKKKRNLRSSFRSTNSPSLRKLKLHPCDATPAVFTHS